MTAPDALKIKIQVFSGEEIAMGPGKADLLEAIRENGSISGGGRAMGMSYRRAWLLVDTMNRCWQGPLVETSPGSARGGGARLTIMGEQVLAHYRSLQNRLNDIAEAGDYAALEAALLPEPRKSQKG
ncbi:MAG TPA: ModE family transcriptional regulator [Novosphingobium sp.]